MIQNYLQAKTEVFYFGKGNCRNDI